MLAFLSGSTKTKFTHTGYNYFLTIFGSFLCFLGDLKKKGLA